MNDLFLCDVQNDWRLLDDAGFMAQGNTRLISHEQFTSCKEICVDYIAPGLLSRCFYFSTIVHEFFYAWRLLTQCRDKGR